MRKFTSDSKLQILKWPGTFSLPIFYKYKTSKVFLIYIFFLVQAPFLDMPLLLLLWSLTYW